MFCMKGARAGPSPAIFNWPLIKSVENGDQWWSELSGGLQQTQQSVKFSVSSGEPHLSAFLYEERSRGSLKVWRIIVSPSPVPPKVQDIPFPGVGIAYFHHQTPVCFPFHLFANHLPLTPCVQRVRCKRVEDIFLKLMETHYVLHVGPHRPL